MAIEPKDVRVIGLLSGGLDSTLALTLMHRLGYQVIVYNFGNGFHSYLHEGQGKPSALKTAARLGVTVRVIDNSREVLGIVKHPDHGYGSNVNPCIDCRILMFRMTMARLKEEGASFIFTGEVVGQRPMSQRRFTMDLIDSASGAGGYVVRPLCGKLLPPTIAEKEGLISREDLLDFSGRGRHRQIELAKAYGITEFEWPAGGCTLTDPGFALRVRDALRFGDPDVHEIQLLKVGRHFRLTERTRLILARDARDCRRLESLTVPGDLLLDPAGMPGPLGMIRGEATPEVLRLAAAILIYYCKAAGPGENGVNVIRSTGPSPENVLPEAADSAPAEPDTGANFVIAGPVIETLRLAAAPHDEVRRLLVAAEGGCGGYKDELMRRSAGGQGAAHKDEAAAAGAPAAGAAPTVEADEEGNSK